MSNNQEILDFVKNLSKLWFSNSHEWSGNRHSERNAILFLRPTSTKDRDVIDFLPYDLRLEIGRMELLEILKSRFKNRGDFNYHPNDYQTYATPQKSTFDELFDNRGYNCYTGVAEYNNNGFPEKYELKLENFHQMFLDSLYDYWDRTIQLYINENQDKEVSKITQICIEYLFQQQLTGHWFFYNRYGQNFLRIYLEYLKERNLKINIFNLFNSKVYSMLNAMHKGTHNYGVHNLFGALNLIFDFYSAVLDMYGNDNKKVVDKLQKNLEEIFVSKIETEKFGFMNTFLYTQKYNSKVSSSNGNIARHFWVAIYNEDLNPVLKKIFINALFLSWNKSPLPKVRNSIKLLVDLSLKKYDNWRGFPYDNEAIFYKDVIMNANRLKKSIKTILFGKVMTEEGGLLL